MAGDLGGAEQGLRDLAGLLTCCSRCSGRVPGVIVLCSPRGSSVLIQRYTFIDFKFAMRSMLATKGRGA